MLGLLSHLFGSLSEVGIRQLTDEFVTNFNRLIFDFQECLSFSNGRFFFPQKFLDKPLHSPSKPVIHDLFPQ